MPIGPNGEKPPADLIANAVHVARIATGETEEEYVNPGKSAGGRKGGAARAKALSAERRSEIAKHGAVARWENGEHEPARTPDDTAPTGNLLYDRLNRRGRI